MNTIEGNKLIAEFMGGITDDSKEWVNSDKKLVGRLIYHLSWDELMPVVEKIEGFDEKPVRFMIMRTECNVSIYAHGGMSVPDRKLSFSTGAKETKIESVWNAVTHFIQWYNEQQKK